MTRTVPADASRIVTVSATYGAGGSVIAPALARDLGLRFVDRTVSSADAAAVEAPTDAEVATSPPSRWFASMAQLMFGVPGVPVHEAGAVNQLDEMRRENTDRVVEAAREGSVVVLGRAAALVLAEHPHALHVRLDGPLEARVARAQEIEGVDAEEARRRAAASDRLRTQFVKRLYGREATDPRLYHVVIDATAFPLDAVVDVLRAAAEAFWRRSPRR